MNRYTLTLLATSAVLLGTSLSASAQDRAAEHCRAEMTRLNVEASRQGVWLQECSAIPTLQCFKRAAITQVEVEACKTQARPMIEALKRK